MDLVLYKLYHETNRNAHFKTVIALIIGGKEFLFEGKVHVQFTVETDGSITNITLLKTDHQLLNQAAIDVIRKMPKWNPASTNSTAIKSQFTLPINLSSG